MYDASKTAPPNMQSMLPMHINNNIIPITDLQKRRRWGGTKRFEPYSRFLDNFVWASHVAQQQRIPMSMQETQEMRDRSLGWEIPWRRKWQPIPEFLPGKFHGQRSLMGYSTVHSVTKSQPWLKHTYKAHLPQLIMPCSYPEKNCQLFFTNI